MFIGFFSLFLGASELEFLWREADAKTLVELNCMHGADLEILRLNLGYEANIKGVGGLNQGKYLV